MPETICRRVGCGNIAKNRPNRLCGKHVHALKPPRKCLAENCSRSTSQNSRDWCEMHRYRIVRGTPLDGREESRTYNAVHHRLRKVKGQARLHKCVNCLNSAAQWAYDGKDPSPLLGTNGPGNGTYWYSTDPDHYVPMCAKCHRASDAAKATAELSDYRRKLAADNGWAVIE